MFVEQKASILCPICGLKFIPDASNICQACTLNSISDQAILSPSEQQLFCTYCNRYERPPWVLCGRQSAELLGILLKKIKGLNKMQIKDAKFVWTQPHSKRIKVKVQFIRSVTETSKIQQIEIVQFIEKYGQCPECRKNFTPHDWNALIQIRQHGSNQRTLFALEQNLIKQKWMDKAMRCQTIDQGYDIFFRYEHDAHGCINYIKCHLPVCEKKSSQLISQNEKDNTNNVKMTFALIIPQVCKDDLLLMHPKWTKSLGNCSPLLLCTKVSSQLYFLDPTNNRRIVITPTQFFALQPYADIYSLKHQAKNYIVLDNEGKRTEESHNIYGSWGLVVALADQMKEIFIKSHINAEVGYQYEGYSLQQWAHLKNLPEHLIVRKVKTQEQKLNKKAKKDEKRRQIRKKQKELRQQQKNSRALQRQKEQLQNGQLQKEQDQKVEGQHGQVQNGDWQDIQDDDLA